LGHCTFQTPSWNSGATLQWSRKREEKGERIGRGVSGKELGKVGPSQC